MIAGIEFRHQAVRDLAWLLASPSLLQHDDVLHDSQVVTDRWCRLAFYDRVPWLRELDRDPSHLESWLAAHEYHLLGRYFELLLEFMLSEWRRMALRASHCQIGQPGRAVGEFDFLFIDRFRERRLHWEVAVKYFLCFRGDDGRYQWLGPNPRDTWDRKVSRLFNHQLDLSRRDEARPLLAGLGMEHPSAEILLKGWLFYPVNGDLRHAGPLPEQASPGHLRGWWCYRGAALPASSPSARWFELPRMRWLSPVRSEEEAPGHDREAMMQLLDQHFACSRKPLLLAELERRSCGAWHESSRGFVVPESWPGV